jgi:hypothetical protein
MTAICFEMPAPSNQPHIFRREFLGAIRKAIGEAQSAGDIDAAIAVECFKALPPATPEQGSVA